MVRHIKKRTFSPPAHRGDKIHLSGRCAQGYEVFRRDYRLAEDERPPAWLEELNRQLSMLRRKSDVEKRFLVFIPRTDRPDARSAG